MLDMRWIRENTPRLQEALAHRGASACLCTDLLAKDEARRAVLNELQDLQNRRNVLSKEIGVAKSNGENAETLFAEMQQVGPKVKALEEKERHINADFEAILSAIPNVPEADVPVGANEDANVEIHRQGTPRDFKKEGFTPKPHYELGAPLGLDFETAAQIAGSRFAWLQGDMARLERALAAFMLDTLREAGFTEIAPPLLVNDASVFGTGQLPKFEEDLFKTTDGRWLIPTAEVSLTNYMQNRIIKEDALPLKFCAYTPCFRSEAGAAGKDTRGYIRQHQFWKVEMVQIVSPEKSAEALEWMTETSEGILKKLGLPYRRIILCTGDMGFSSQKTYDLDVWLPAQDTYREISSCSNCGDFQARRMKGRFKQKEKGKTCFVHTLNGSALATGRTLVAVLENYQNKDGSVSIPEVIRPYLGGLEKLEKVK